MIDRSTEIAVMVALGAGVGVAIWVLCRIIDAIGLR